MLVANLQENIKENLLVKEKEYVLDTGNITIPILYLEIRYLIEKVILVLLSPLWLPIFIATYVTLKFIYGGKCLFKQVRPGKGNTTFYIYKFKSMRDIDPNCETTQHEEDRITSFGRFIRKHRIDELPQFLNVLKGEMSLIGPRPDALNCHLEWRQSIPQYDLKYLIKPGITGYGQAYYKHVSDIEEVFEKFKYDVYYLNNISFLTDFKIVFKTIEVMFTGYGAR